MYLSLDLLSSFCSTDVWQYDERTISSWTLIKNRLNYKNNNKKINLYLPWNIAELILIRTMDMIVPVQKLSCHWSVSTLVITQVTPNKRMTKIKLTNNLGVVLKYGFCNKSFRNLWPVEHFYNIFVLTIGRDCYCIQQSRPKVRTNML